MTKFRLIMYEVKYKVLILFEDITEIFGDWNMFVHTQHPPTIPHHPYPIIHTQHTHSRGRYNAQDKIVLRSVQKHSNNSNLTKGDIHWMWRLLVSYYLTVAMFMVWIDHPQLGIVKQGEVRTGLRDVCDHSCTKSSVFCICLTSNIWNW